MEATRAQQVTKIEGPIVFLNSLVARVQNEPAVEAATSGLLSHDESEKVLALAPQWTALCAVSGLTSTTGGDGSSSSSSENVLRPGHFKKLIYIAELIRSCVSTPGPLATASPTESGVDNIKQNFNNITTPASAAPQFLSTDSSGSATGKEGGGGGSSATTAADAITDEQQQSSLATRLERILDRLRMLICPHATTLSAALAATPVADCAASLGTLTDSDIASTEYIRMWLAKEAASTLKGQGLSELSSPRSKTLLPPGHSKKLAIALDMLAASN